MGALIGSTSPRNLGVRVQAGVRLTGFLPVDIHLPRLRIVVAFACRDRLGLRRSIPRTGLRYFCAGSGSFLVVTARRSAMIRWQG